MLLEFYGKLTKFVDKNISVNIDSVKIYYVIIVIILEY